MDRLTLHIGHPKTGTSSIQATLRRNAAILAGQGVYYFAHDRNNHALARIFTDDSRPGDAATFARFRREAGRTAAAQGIVSSEVFCRFRDEEVAAALAALRPLAGRVDAVLYVRHPVSFASSAAHQAIRAGGLLSEVVARPRILPLRNIVERWARATGALTVRPFARERLAGGDVVDDLLATVGLGALAPRLERVFINEGLSALGVALLERALAHAPGRAMQKAAMRPFDAVGGPRYVLPAATLAEVRRRTAADLDWLRDRHGIDLPEPLDEPTPPPALSDAELETLAATLYRLSSHTFRADRSALARLGLPHSAFFRPGDEEPGGVLAALARRFGPKPAAENPTRGGGGGRKQG